MKTGNKIYDAFCKKFKNDDPDIVWKWTGIDLMIRVEDWAGERTDVTVQCCTDLESRQVDIVTFDGSDKHNPEIGKIVVIIPHDDEHEPYEFFTRKPLKILLVQ